MHEVIIVIPVYKENMTYYEEISLRQCRSVLWKYDIAFVAPAGLNMAAYQKIINIPTIYFSENYFKSVDTYNNLMMAKGFYSRFKKYRHMLVYQLDAFVFADELERFLDLNFDYIGAPWLSGMPYYEYSFHGMKYFRRICPSFNKPIELYVGNGGLSLRNIAAVIKILDEHSETVKTWSGSEDIFFSFCGKNNSSDFTVASIDVALRFSFETEPRVCYELNKNKLPFGCHAWEKYDMKFMGKYIREFGYEI